MDTRDFASCYIHRGPLLNDFLSVESADVDTYLEQGGYGLARQVFRQSRSGDVLRELERAGLRGRGGGGYPTAHKWSLVANREAPEKFFICNASSGGPGAFKNRFLLSSNPHRVIESVLIGAFAVGSHTAFLYLPGQFSREAELLESARREAMERGFLGAHAFGGEYACDVLIFRGMGGYIGGEETAAIAAIEGELAQPRRKPPMPTTRGLYGAPTAVNNLETVLHAYHILKVGAEEYRRYGSRRSPGTILCCVSGHVKRPGIYEVGMGTRVSELVYDYAQGPPAGMAVKAILPGGIASAALDAAQLDIRLDFDELNDAGTGIGSGSLIVIGSGVDIRSLACTLADFFHRESCGRCFACREGTGRLSAILASVDGSQMDWNALADGAPSGTPDPRLKILPPGCAYTDASKGIGKIVRACEYFQYRADCHHAVEAAASVLRLIELFPGEFRADVCRREEYAWT